MPARRSLVAAALLAILSLVASIAAAPSALADYPAPSMQFVGVGTTPTPGPQGMTINWSSGDGSPAALFRSINGGPFKQLGSGFTSNSQVINDVPLSAPQGYQVRQLGKHPKVLVDAVVQNGVPRVVSVTRPDLPHSVPHWLGPFLHVLIYLVYLLFGALGLLYLLSLRGLRRVA